MCVSSTLHSYLGMVVGCRRGGRNWAFRGNDIEFSSRGGGITLCSTKGKGGIELEKSSKRAQKYGTFFGPRIFFTF